MTTLLVVGAGPKAVALSAKAAALRNIGFGVPDLVVVEKDAIAANWAGGDYTDGQRLLGTPPEKDVGFPYQSTAWGAEFDRPVDQEMRRFSWHQYLISISHAPGPYWTWVDRGRPQPKHGEWAQYLRWVAAAAGLTPKIGEVTQIDISKDERWRLKYRTRKQSTAQVEGDGLVITGPGIVAERFDAVGAPNFFTVAKFWRNLKRFDNLDAARVCVVGAGETAASVIVALLERVRESTTIAVVAPRGTILSRGENFSENRIYSDPSNWIRLSSDHREDFMNRTDRGVFSQQAQDVINAAGNIFTIPGHVRAVVCKPRSKDLTVIVTYDVDRVNPRRQSYDYEYVVDAGQSEPLWFKRLVTTAAKARIAPHADIDSSALMQSQIAEALEVRDLRPRLHLPMLSGFAQGPGFPNLSCLGLLADRILNPYVTRAERPRGDRTRIEVDLRSAPWRAGSAP